MPPKTTAAPAAATKGKTATTEKKTATSASAPTTAAARPVIGVYKLDDITKPFETVAIAPIFLAPIRVDLVHDVHKKSVSYQHKHDSDAADESHRRDRHTLAIAESSKRIHTLTTAI